MDYGIPVNLIVQRKYNHISEKSIVNGQSLEHCTPRRFIGLEKIIMDDQRKTISKKRCNAIAEINSYYKDHPDVILRIYNFLATKKIDNVAFDKLLKACETYVEVGTTTLNANQLLCENLNAISSEDYDRYVEGGGIFSQKLLYNEKNFIYPNLQLANPVPFVTKPLSKYGNYREWLMGNFNNFQTNFNKEVKQEKTDSIVLNYLFEKESAARAARRNGAFRTTYGLPSDVKEI